MTTLKRIRQSQADYRRAHLHELPCSAVGASVFRGTTCLDPSDWTLEEAAIAEMYSRAEAKRRWLQTTLDPDTGFGLVWDAGHDPDARALYERMLEGVMADE